jgi:NAD-dependent SIR2 family protein deacetylase
MAIHLNILFRKYKESGYDTIAIKLNTSEAIYRLQNPVSEKNAMHAHLVIKNMYCSTCNRKSETKYLIKKVTLNNALSCN